MWKVTARTLQTSSAVALIAANCLAHDGAHETGSSFVDIEFSQILTAIGLIASLAIYVLGLSRLWRHAGRDRGISVWSAASFFAGWISLAAALIGPLHDLSETLFSAHMTQHEILMLVSAPLIILGRPQIAAVWSLSVRWRQNIRLVTNNSTFETAWHFVTGSFAAFLIHAAALWIWHIPTLFDATLESDAVHALQHASFFGTALLFWWAIVNSGLEWKSSFVGVLFLFLTSLHSGILGAFLTFTRQIWYPVYQNSTASYGLTPLEDQQLGGLIMWVPAGLVYIGAGLIMFARMLSQTERRSLDVDQQLITG
jgi:cytochrome c oxidase assembly factor CtaG